MILTTYYLLLATCYLLLATYHSPLTTYYLLPQEILERYPDPWRTLIRGGG